jgi:hypothetical protein
LPTTPVRKERTVSRTVRAFFPIAGSPDPIEQAFLSEPLRWVPSAHTQTTDALQVVVRAGALSRHVLLVLGAPWRNNTTIWRSLQWDPVAEGGEPATIDRWLPSLDGEIGLNRRRKDDQLTLVLDGRYAPPGGPLGSAIDAAVLGRVAQATVNRFLVDLASGLTAESMLTTPRASQTPVSRREASPSR